MSRMTLLSYLITQGVLELVYIDVFSSDRVYCSIASYNGSEVDQVLGSDWLQWLVGVGMVL